MEDPEKKKDRKKFEKFCKRYEFEYDFTFERGCYQETDTFQAYIIWRYAEDHK